MISTSLPSVFTSKNQASGKPGKSMQAPQPSFAGNRPDSFQKRAQPAVRFGADSHQAVSDDRPFYQNKTTRDLIIRGLLNTLKIGTRERQDLKRDLTRFHTEDDRASNFAELFPEAYVQAISTIVNTARNEGTKRGRAAFDNFMDQTTLVLNVPPRNTASSSSLLNQPRSHQREQRGNSPTRRGEYIRGGDGRLYRKEREEGNRTQRGVYSGPHPG
jgi:hypothetical protein